MKLSERAIAGGGRMAWCCDERSTLKIGLPEGLMGFAGVACLLVGASFVMGAVQEEEPEAAATGLRIFGAAGLGLLLLSALGIWRRNR